MVRTVIPAAAVAAAMAIATAGCGSAGATPGSGEGAATVVPANAIAFVAASTDLLSSQWHSLGGFLLRNVPNWTNEIEPALGDELDVAVLPGKRIVALTQPHDASKLAALAAAYKLSTRNVGSWTALAEDASSLEQLGNPSATLAQSSAFQAAMSRLPSNALVRAYLNGSAAQRLIEALPGQAQALLPAFHWVAADVHSLDAGLELEAFARTEAPTADALRSAQLLKRPAASYTPTLVDEIPADVLAVADFQVQQNAFEAWKLPPALAKAFGVSAATVPVQLDALLGGETAVYLRAGAPLPEVTLVTQPADAAAAASAVTQLQSELQAPFLQRLHLYTAVIGGQFVVSTSQQGIADLGAGGPKLANDADFLEAQKDAQMPTETTGFVYANVKKALPLLSLVGATMPAGAPDVRTFIAYGARTADEVRFTAFLASR